MNWKEGSHRIQVAGVTLMWTAPGIWLVYRLLVAFAHNFSTLDHLQTMGGLVLIWCVCQFLTGFLFLTIGWIMEGFAQ